MQKRLNHFMLLFVVIAVVMTSAVRTTPVYADDGGTEPPTGESTPPPSEEGASVEETSPAEEPVAATEVPAAEPVVEEIATEPAVEEPAVVAEVLEQLPEGTELVVVNEAGEVEPLASAEAAEIIATGDPIWCPEGQVPTPGTNGCTPSYIDFASLITELTTGAYSGNGTIWVESSYNGNDNSPVVFNGTQLSTLNNLTVQGGWSGVSGDNTIGAASLMDVSLSFVNWTGDITINNLSIDVTSANTTGSGLYVNTIGNITVNNVSVIDDAANTKGSGYGAILTNTRNPSVVRNVTVTNSQFNGNSLTGLYIDSFGTATLTSVQANSNGYGLDITADAGMGLTGVIASSNSYFGGILDTTFGTGAITVTNSNFGVDTATGNGWTGLHAESGSTITLNNVVSSYNGTNGAYLVAEDNIAVTNSTFNNNVLFNYPEDPGLFALSNGGNITLNSVTANNNVYGAGVVLDTYGSGGININGGQFNGNGTFGIQAGSDDGDITLNNVTASFNQVKGAYLGSFWSGNIIINNSTFTENGSYGIYAFASEGNINLNGVTVTGNNLTNYGAVLLTGGNVSVSASTFSLNTDVGLVIVSGGQVTLNNVTADQNGGNGVEVYSISTAGPICQGETPVDITVTVNGGTFSNNGGYGLLVKPGPQGILELNGSPNFVNNTLGDYLLDLSQQYKDCTPKEEEPCDSKEPLVVDVPSTGGPVVEQDCDLYSGTILKLPNGTWVKVGCPFEGFSKLEEVTQENLPGPLGDGITFETAIALGLIDEEGNVILNEDGTVTINFIIPEDSRARHHSILFWDMALNDGKGGWMQLPPYEIGTSFPLNPKNPDDPRTIISGVKQVGDTVTVTVDFSGVFVLVGQ